MTWGRGARDYHVFDVLWLDGRDVTPLPLDERRALLRRCRCEPPLQRVDAARRRRSRGSAPCREGWEGVIAKRRDSPYEHRRSPHWLKMKCEAAQELVVGGFTDPQGARVGLGALLVGYFDDDDFVFAGKVGTGFDTKLLLDLRARLDALEIADVAVHESQGAAAAARALGAPGDRRPGRVHRVDGPRQAAPSALLGVRHDKAAREVITGADVITHPEKVLFPDDGITKGELAAYYEAIAPLMLPHIRGRPVTMERYPAGIGEKGFFQKDVSKGFPEWLERVEVPKKDGTVHHPLVTDTRSLLWMANQNTHHAARLDVARAGLCTARTSASSISIRPTTMQPDVLRAAALGAARSARRARPAELGEDVGLEGLPHRRAARRQDATTATVARFAHAVGDAARRRAIRSTSRRSSARPIAAGASSSTPAATATARRSPPRTPCARKPGAPVSAPCTWEEIERGDVGPRTFTLRTMAARIADVGDLWSDMRRRKRSLRRAVEKLEKLR